MSTKFFGAILVGFSLLYSGEAFTSQEGILELKSFQLESKSADPAGPFLVKGTKNKEGVLDSLNVTAFGKEVSVPKALLAQIMVPANGIQLSFERGYRDLGGKTFYITFIKGFTSGIVDKKVLVIKEDGSSKLLENP